MKLAFVAPAYPYRGGIAHFGVRLARYMSGRHSLLYLNFSRLYPAIFFPGKTQFDKSQSPLTFPNERVIDSLIPTTWLTAARKIRQWGADAVVFHWWHPFFAPAYRTIASQVSRRAASVAICHNVAPHEAGAFYRAGVRLGLGAMNGLVLHAQSEKDVLAQILPAKRHINLFHPVYDIFPGERIPKLVARNLLGLPPEARVVLYFGLIRPYKGVEVLLKAAQLLADIPDLKLIVLGEIYTNREQLLGLVETAPKGMVTLVDRYIPNEDVAAWFRASDLVALPYLSATQSGVVPIAYRCQRPVVVTNVGGLPDIVQPGESGYLVEPNDPTGLAEAIREHFVGRGAPDMTAGIETMCQKLSWENYAAELESFIYRLQIGAG